MSRIVQIPALIDLHCHLREPGFEYKETIQTGLDAAQHGGYAAICTMPNTKPVCDEVETIKYIINEAKKQKNVRVLPVAAVTKNLDSEELTDFKSLKKAGAIAFSNDGLPILDKAIFKKALESEELIMSHCENETKEVQWQIEIFKEVSKNFTPRLHFCHISKKESVELIREAKKNLKNLSAETAPHYLILTKENVTNDGVYKMNPPLGSIIDQKALIAGILDGTIDAIGTDHAPHSKEEKLKNYNLALNGITGFETAFSIIYSVFGLDKTVELMALNPAKILKIKNDKTIKVDLEQRWVFTASNSLSKCKVSPYDSMEFIGKVII